MGRRAMIGMMIAILLVAVTVVSIAPNEHVSASGNTYYVDGVIGSDTTGNGSSSHPWKTISKAASLMTAGDTAKIRSGVYRETVKPVNSGTAGNPITFEPDTGADVTVSGADVISGPWTVHSGHIYKTNATLQMGDFLDQVYVDGVSNHLARSPNSAVTNLFDPALYRRRRYLRRAFGDIVGKQDVHLHDGIDRYKRNDLCLQADNRRIRMDRRYHGFQ